ncbi:MAG: hypothetical protein ACTHK0_01405, partial [Ginsengibacter sp.]
MTNFLREGQIFIKRNCFKTLALKLEMNILKLFINQNQRRYIMKLLKGNGNLMNQMPLLFDDFFNRDI